MIRKYDEGLLQAYLDGALGGEEQENVAVHIAGCAGCQSQLAELRELSAHVAELLVIPVPDPRLVLAQVSGKDTNFQGTQRAKDHILAPAWFNSYRPLLARLAIVMAVLSLLAFPSVRAAADQFLQVFRVQRVVYLPVSPERIRQLQSLNFDGRTLFAARPALVNKPAAPRQVGSLGSAVSLIGFTPQAPTVFPSVVSSTEYLVTDRSIYQTQVNVQSLRQLLTLLNVNDVTIPDALGAGPIKADLAPAVVARYTGVGYTMTLYQGQSPNVSMPEGVDLSQVGKAVLRILGMESQQAETLSHQIDWRSTFIFPFPDQVTNIRQIPVGSAQGLMVSGSKGSETSMRLYWQSGDRFYMLEGRGALSPNDFIATAVSVQ